MGKRYCELSRFGYSAGKGACRPVTFLQNPRVFHLPPYDDVTTKMMSDPDPEIASMGWNLFHDPRISAARFSQFDDLHRNRTAPPVYPEPLKDALTDYWVQKVSCSTPAFLGNDNRNNYYAPAGLLPPPPPDARLVRVLNLSRMHGVFERAKKASHPGFSDYGKQKSTDQPGRTGTAWLDEELADFHKGVKNGLDPAHVQANPILQELLAFLRTDHITNPHEPAWATLWSEFSDQDQCPQPAQWLQRVGIPPFKEDAWYLLLLYEARRVPELVRPTQLDGGWFPQHFPVPPSAKDGHALDLDLSPHEVLRPEFIHRQIAHELTDLLALARLGTSPQPPLAPPQQRHYRLLARQYPDTPAMTLQVPHPAFR